MNKENISVLVRGKGRAESFSFSCQILGTPPVILQNNLFIIKILEGDAEWEGQKVGKGETGNRREMEESLKSGGRQGRLL